MPPPWSGFFWPPISHLLRVLFLFLRFFLLCVYFLLFFKIRRKKIPRKWAFYKKYESYFSCPAHKGWGDQAPLQGPIAPALYPSPCFMSPQSPCVCA